MRLCRLGEDLGNMGRWGDTLEAGDEPGLGQRNFRTDPRSGGEAAGMRHPDARALCRYVTAIHVELPGHEPDTTSDVVHDLAVRNPNAAFFSQ